MESTTAIGKSDIVKFSEVHTTMSTNATLRADFINQSLSQNGKTMTNYLNQTEPWYGEADIPLPVLTYILFGLTCFKILLGLLGNSLILTIMIKYRETPLKGHNILIIALALFDGIALIPAALTQSCVYEVLGKDLRAITTVGCKLFTGIRLSAAICSFTVVVLICIERFVAVWYPLRSMYILSRKLVLRCLLISTIIVVIMYISLSVLYSEIADGRCNPNFAGQIYSTVLNRVPDTTLYNGVLGVHLISYLVILFSLTPMIIVKLYKQKALRHLLTRAEQDIGHFRTSVKLTSVVVAFVILVALPGSLIIVMGIAGIQLNDTNKTLLSWLTLSLLLNHSVNFLLYHMFDANFRKNALNLLQFDNESSPLVGLDAKAEAETSFNR